MALAIAESSLTTLSNSFFCTYRRDPAVQTWPWLKKIACAAPTAACAGSASSRTMTGDLPPSSSDTRVMFSIAARWTSLPTAVDPVNAIFATPGWEARAAPAVSPSPVTMLTTPGGMPASRMSWPRRSAVSGVSSAGLSTTVQPAASAGPIFQAAISSGKFHGMIAPTTPTGSRRVHAKNLACGMNGTDTSCVAPSILVAQPAM